MGQKPDRRYLREEGLVLVHGWKVQSITARSGYRAAEVAASCGSRNMGLLTSGHIRKECWHAVCIFLLHRSAPLMPFLLIRPVK